MRGKPSTRHDLLSPRDAYIGILLLGAVSLMGDVVYEGSRGLVPDYLRFLGATAFIVGLIGGLGEFMGYAVRLASGYLADTTRAYWLLIFIGYGLIASIPLLGVAATWETAIILILLERLGKALRSSPRDTLLSIISRDVGAGKAFGIHEFLDQTGAVAGPLIVTALMYYNGNSYQETFASLSMPFLMLLVALAYTHRRIGSKAVAGSEGAGGDAGKPKPPGKPFYIYTSAVTLNTVGLIPAALILYKASIILQPGQRWMVPMIYLLIQGMDAPAALLSGYAYDRFGVKFLTLPFMFSMLPSFLALAGAGLPSLIVASILFGVVLGMQESIYRAAVSDYTPVSSRGTAYGIFNTAYGIGFLISGLIYGLLIDLKASPAAALPFIISTQISAVIALLGTLRRQGEARSAAARQPSQAEDEDR
ncbi:MFS transporter [Candidatus Bathyarchaeota archaeon]|nr:MFS transporter [Candidatus Bathyarchaeota archaeon]